MLQNKQVVFHAKRKAMRNIYVDGKELDDLLNNCTTGEMRLYSLLVNSVLINPSPEYFETKNLAKALDVSEGTIKNARSGLTKKGYIIINKFKDENGEPMVRVVIGKDQVELYNLGLKVEIKDSRAYKKLCKEFPITDPNLSIDERKKLVEQANRAYQTNPEQYS
jgi:hypothetical protein